MNEDKISSLTDKIGMKTWHVLALGMVTFGIYYIIWLLDRYKVFNEMANSEIISRNFIVSIAILMGISLLLGSLGDPTIALFASLIDLAWGIMLIMMSFKVSKTMEDFYAQKFKLDLKFNKFYLVLFNIFYINYCVNELVEIERKESFLNKEES